MSRPEKHELSKVAVVLPVYVASAHIQYYFLAYLYSLDEGKKDVGVQCTLVCLVEYNDRVLRQLAIDHRLTQHHTISQILSR